MSTPRPAALVVAAVIAAGLPLAACGQETPPLVTGRTTTPDDVLAGPGPAPEAVVDAPADEVWGLAQLVPPDDLAVTSSVRRPDADGLASYLLVGTTTPDGAAALCDQVGGLVPVPADGLAGTDLDGWGLAQAPAGELGTCGAPEPVVPSVLRDVLAATADGTTTVWVSAYDTPLP